MTTVTKWHIKFRGDVWQTHTVASADHEAAEKCMGRILADAKQDDPECADDYTLTEEIGVTGDVQ